MADTQQEKTYPGTGPYANLSHKEPSRWGGFVSFAGIMLVMIGGFQAIEGVVALFKDDYYLVTRNGLLISMDYTAWGWVHLIIGLVAIGTGFGIVAGQMWPRVTG